MNTQTVSVIIPVYNGEKYFMRCLDSVINQSYQSINIIIVDDNSTDNSGNLALKYCSEYKNISYIKNTCNKGVAYTRNVGLDSSTSEYVLFLDCDDWLDLNCIERAIDKFRVDSDIDIVTWEIKTAYSYNRISSRYAYTYDNIITGTMATQLLSHSVENEYFLSPLLGCKLFKKCLISDNNIKFPETIFEDDMFTYLSFINARKVGLVTGSCLYYYQHSESLTHNFSKRYIIDFFKTFNLMYKCTKTENKESYYKFLDKSLRSMIDAMMNTTSDLYLLQEYKALIFKNFYTNVNIAEYYTYSSALTI